MRFLDVGTALAGLNQGYQQQQAQQQQMALRALAMRQSQQEAQQRQQTQQGQQAAYLAALALKPQGQAPGGPGLPQMPATGGGPTIDMSQGDDGSYSVAPQASAGAGLAPGFARSPDGGLTRNGQPPDTMLPGGTPAWNDGPSGGGGIADYIRQGAASRGIDPDYATRVANTEGGTGRFKLGDGGTSGGPFQLHVGGGMGDDFRRDTGLDPLNPSSERRGVDYALDYAKAHGGRFDPNIWHGARSLGAGGQGGGTPDPIALSRQATARAVQSSPASIYGGTQNLQTMAQAIEKANPGLPPAVKFLALQNLQKLMAPDERVAMQLMLAQNREELQRDLFLFKQQNAPEKPGPVGQTFVGADGKPYNIVGNKATPIEGLPAAGEGQAPVTRVGTPPKPSQAAVSPEAQKLVAQGIANYQLPPLSGWAMKTPNGQQTMAEVMKLNPDYKATKFTGEQSGARAMGTRSANLEMATDVAEEQIPLVEATSDRIDRTQFPTLNSLVMAVEKGTGGEDVVRFMEQINTLKYVYARALNPTGVARIQDLERFDNILNQAWSQGQVRAALDQIRQSLKAERRGVDRARSGEKPAEAAPPTQMPTAVGPDGAEIHYDGKAWVDKDGKPVQ